MKKLVIAAMIFMFVCIGAMCHEASAAKVLATATVNSEADWTAMKEMKGVFNVSIVSSSFSGTITLQRSFDKGANWMDVETWVSTGTEEWKFEPEAGVVYRLGCDTGDFTSGSATVRLSQ